MFFPRIAPAQYHTVVLTAQIYQNCFKISEGSPYKLPPRTPRVAPVAAYWQYPRDNMGTRQCTRHSSLTKTGLTQNGYE